MGKQGGGVFTNWLKHFTSMVFMQTFHAIFLLFIMLMLYEVNVKVNAINGTNTNISSRTYILAILTIVGSTALIKMEKMIKQIFGISEHMAGDFKAASLKTMMAFKGASSLIGNVSSNVKQAAEARRNVIKTGRKYNAAYGKDGYMQKSERKDPYLTGMTEEQKKKYREEKYNDLNSLKYFQKPYAKNKKSEKLDNDIREESNQRVSQNQAEGGTPGQNAGETTGRVDVNINTASGVEARATATGAATTQVNQGAAGGEQQMSEQARWRLEDKKDAYDERKLKLQEEHDQALAKWKAHRRSVLPSIGGSIAAASIGIGMTDEITEGLAAGAIIGKPVDVAIDATFKGIANREAYKATGNVEFDQKQFRTAVKEATETILTGGVVTGERKEQRKVDRKNREPRDISDI